MANFRGRKTPRKKQYTKIAKYGKKKSKTKNKLQATCTNIKWSYILFMIDY